MPSFDSPHFLHKQIMRAPEFDCFIVLFYPGNQKSTNALVAEARLFKIIHRSAFLMITRVTRMPKPGQRLKRLCHRRECFGRSPRLRQGGEMQHDEKRHQISRNEQQG